MCEHTDGSVSGHSKGGLFEPAAENAGHANPGCAQAFGRGHRLSQQDIARLEKDHQVKADRGTIRRNLSRLVEFGYDIEWTEIPAAAAETPSVPLVHPAAL